MLCQPLHDRIRTNTRTCALCCRELQIIHTDLKPENAMLCQPLHDRTWILPDPAELAAAAAQRASSKPQISGPRCAGMFLLCVWAVGLDHHSVVLGDVGLTALGCMFLWPCPFAVRL